VSFIHRRLGLGIFAAAVLAGAAVAVPAAALASSGQHAASVAKCSNSNTYAWLALAPNAAAGTTYYPIEFTNTGKSSCTLYGYPGVQGLASASKTVGPAASRVTQTRKTVTLAPGQTAHATLGIVVAGNIAGCQSAAASGLQVYAPNETRKQIITNFSFTACKNKIYLHVYPVQSGLGLPN
jgi:hypothetical protein